MSNCRWCGREYDCIDTPGSSQYYCSKKCEHEAEQAG